jgi:hypothetical protein
VYQWGTFRSNTGIFGMKGAEDACLSVPTLVSELPNVVSIASGSNHFVAVTSEGITRLLIMQGKFILGEWANRGSLVESRWEEIS